MTDIVSTEDNAVDLDTSGGEAEIKTPLLNALRVHIHQFGKTFSAEDLTIGLPRTEADISLDMIPQVVARAGLVGRVKTTRSLNIKDFPCSVLLKDNSFVVVTAFNKSKTKSEYVLADTDILGGEKRIDAKTLSENYGGVTITALPDIEDIQRRHTSRTYKSHWFWGRFKSQKKIIADIILGTFIANVLAVAVSLFALQVYDRVIPNQSSTTLWVLAVGCLVAIGFEALLRMARSYLMDVSGKLIELEVASFLFEKLTHMRLSARTSSPGSYVYMMREFSSIREFFTATSVGSVADIPFVIIFLALIYAIAGPLVWIIVAAMVFIMLPSLLFQGKMSRLSEEMLGGTSAAGRLLTEVAYAHEAVKTTRGEGFFQRKWDEINLLNATKMTEQRALAAGLTFWATSVQQLAYIGTIIAGVYMIFAGNFTIGTIIAVSILTMRTLAPITQLSGALSRWQQIKIALKDLDTIATSPQERPTDRVFARKEVLKGNIVLTDTKFSYDEDDEPQLKISNLTISDGEIIALLGENGSGKSTLLKALSGLYDINAGSLTIDGLDFRQLDPEDIRRNIGYLSQDVKLFHGTLRENLILGRHHISEELLFKAIAFAGLDKFVSTHPRGLDMMISDGGEGMSMGQRQSTEIARLYLQDPRIVLMDEPTASLDQTLESRLVARLREWLKGRTCIIATHRLPLVSLTSRILVMYNGSIKLDGSREDVMKQLIGSTHKRRADDSLSNNRRRTDQTGTAAQAPVIKTKSA